MTIQDFRHLRKRGRAQSSSGGTSIGQSDEPPVASTSTASRQSTRMDVDEQLFPEADSDSDYDIDEVIVTNNRPRIDEHDMDFDEQTKCLARDGNVCVVTGAADPKACHIAPFTWNDTRGRINRTFKMCTARAYILGCAFADRTGYLDDRNEPGASDKAWNMLSLHPQLYTWWSKGYFAFKCLQVQPRGCSESNVVLEFLWMPQTKRWFGQHIDIFNTGRGNDLKEWIEGIDRFHASGDPPPMTGDGVRLQATTNEGAPLRSGKLIHIRMQKEDAFHFKDMIDMQWGCILITALSGAAGSPQLLSNKDSDDRVMQWIQNQARFVEEHGLGSLEME
ncbi:hypothetical protein IL306_002764 [Fusarium sp. DS 682]|nr:hypothetical protein IL306_002764 [Fusarium sp. DS 682]